MPERRCPYDSRHAGSRQNKAAHLVAGAALCLVAALAAMPVPAQTDGAALLPEGPGRQQVLAICGACHSIRLVVQQGLTREGWQELLLWMYEEQGMVQLDPTVEKQVLDYLATHIGPDSQKKRLREGGILRQR